MHDEVENIRIKPQTASRSLGMEHCVILVLGMRNAAGASYFDACPCLVILENVRNTMGSSQSL